MTSPMPERAWYYDRGVQQLISFLVIASSIIVICFSLQFYVKTDFNQTKVTSIFLSSGSTACGYIINGNSDYAEPCQYKLSDKITTYKDGLGTWHIKGVGIW